jgi:hypothetical protein
MRDLELRLWECDSLTVECTMPALMSSRQTVGHPTVCASLRASVVLPDPGGPLTTIS